MQFREKYEIVQRFLPAPSKRRSGQAMSPGVRFIVAHDTGNPRSTAANNVAYYTRTSDEVEASAHLFVDDREIIECVPALTADPEKAWHVLRRVPVDDQLYGHDANDAAIGIEYCYGSNIDADKAYDRYVWVTAYACFRFGLDPESTIVGHFFLDPQRRTDPMTGLAHSRRTYDQFLRDVAQEYAECSREEEPGPDDSTELVAPLPLQTTVRLNLRQGRANTRVPVVRTMPVGERITATHQKADGETVNGNPLWYANASGNFFWSGGVQPVAPQGQG